MTLAYSLSASCAVMAEPPQNDPVAGRDQPTTIAEPERLMPDQTETPRMKAWCDLHYGLFIHFGMNTFGEGEHPGALPVSAYQPVKLDVDSWVRVARDAGMKYAVLTAKHDSGFCLWDSKAPWNGKEFDYDVATSDYKTDVVRAFMDACKKYSMVPGLYYGLRDANTGQGRGKPMRKDYFNLVKAHLTELTTRYPECHYYWIDNPDSSDVEQAAALYELLRRADPRNIVQFNAHLACPWTKPTSEDASAQNPGASVFEKSRGHGFPTDVIGSENRLPQTPVAKNQRWNGRQYFVGYEHCAMFGGSWFKSQKVPNSTQGTFSLYQKVRKLGGNLLLDIGPDRQGQIDERYAKLLLELKARIEPFEASLAKGDP